MKLKKNNIMILILIGLFILLAIIFLFLINNYSGIAGNSSFENFYCENSDFELVGNQCIKNEEIDSVLMGDMNNDRIVNEADLQILTSYVRNSVNSWYADLNDDGYTDYTDMEILHQYVGNTFDEMSVGTYDIGVRNRCPRNTKNTTYELLDDGIKCKATTKMNAKSGDTYTVSYDGNGGVGNMSQQTINYNSSVSILKNSFVNDGYNFQGWKIYNESQKKWMCYLDDNHKNQEWTTEENCTKYGYFILSDGSSINRLAQPGESIILLASWNGNKPKNENGIYTIIFDGNGGKGNMTQQKVTLNNIVAINTNQYKSNGLFLGWFAYNKNKQQGYCYLDNGHKKKGWIDQNSCDYGYYLFKNNEQINNLGLSGEQIYLVAQWNDKYNISYDGGGASGTMQKQSITYGISTPLKGIRFSKKNYRFIGWKAHNINTNKWYCYNSDKKSKSWLDKANCTNGYYLYQDKEKVSKTALPGETVKMTAQWNNKFTITYKSGGASGSMPDQVISYGKETKLRSVKYKKDNNAFVGWKAHNVSTKKWYCYTKNGKSAEWMKSNNCKNGYYLYKDREKISKTALPGEKVEMTATWTDKFTISYKKGKGKGSMSNQIITYGKGSQKLRNNTFKRKNMHFVGWKVHNVSTDQWKCFTNKSQTREGWSKKSVCQKNGYKLYLNHAVVSKLSQPGTKVNVIAKWSKYEYAESNGIIYPIKNYNLVGTKKGLSTYFNFSAGNVSQCPWYAKYRAIEIVMTSSLNGDEKEKAKKILNDTSGNGNKWYGGVSPTLKKFKYTNNVNKARAGSIASWEMNSHSYGHVGVVEKVYNDGSILLSEGWNRFGANGGNGVNAIKIVTRKMSKSAVKNYNGKGRFKGYTYLF